MEFDFSRIQDTMAAAAPDREAIVWRDRRLTHAQLAERCRRLANYLLSRGIRVHAERSALEGQTRTEPPSFVSRLAFRGGPTTSRPRP